jgi:hypothetical protein
MRKINSKNEARTCLALAADIGLPRARWARMNGIDGRSLHAWHLNLTRHEPETVAFVELVPTPVVRAAAAASPGRVLRLRCGDLLVEVPDDFDVDHLRRVLRAVREC